MRSRLCSIRGGVILLAWFSTIGILGGCSGLILSGDRRDAFHAPSPLDILLRWSSAYRPPAGILRAFASVEIAGPTGRLPFQAAVLLRRPDRLRIEVLPPIGPPSLLLTIEDDRLRAYMAGNGTFYTGTASRSYPSLLPGTSIPPRDLIFLFTGSPPPLPAGALALREEKHPDGWKILASHERGTWIFWLDTEWRLVQVQAESGEDGGTYTARFSEFVQKHGWVLPGKIELDGGGALRMEIRYRETDIVAEAPDMFSLPVPGGVSPVSLDTPTAPGLTSIP